MRRVLSFFNLVVTTIVLSTVALCVAPFDRGGETAHKLACFWAHIYLRIAGIKVSLTGAEKVAAPPYIFMCNHQSALDIHVLLAYLPCSFKFIAKKSLFLIPFIGWTMKRAGYISLDRENPRKALKAMDEAAERIQDGANILVFPEGTRPDSAGRYLRHLGVSAGGLSGPCARGQCLHTPRGTDSGHRQRRRIQGRGHARGQGEGGGTHPLRLGSLGW